MKKTLSFSLILSLFLQLQAFSAQDTASPSASPAPVELTPKAIETAANAPITTGKQKTPWEQIDEEDGITVFKREVEGSPLVAFKGETTISAPIGKITQILMDTSRKGEWVASMAAAKNIKVISKTERIEYNHTKTPWPLKDRDFVFHAKAERSEDQKSLVIKIHSVVDPSTPPDDSKVRGHLTESSYVLTPSTDGSKTKITVEIELDPQGDIPKWIVNLFQKSWPRKTLTGIRNQAAKADVLEDKEVTAAFVKTGNPIAAGTTPTK